MEAYVERFRLMSRLSDELMNLKFLVTEANLLEYGLLRRGQRISPISLVGFRDTPDIKTRGRGAHCPGVD